MLLSNEEMQESIRKDRVDSGDASHRSILRTINASTVSPRPIDWLWPGYIALGKLTLVAGDPGLGKSILTAALASHVSNGSAWPVSGAECPKGSVVMASAEDDLADTIRPRLDAAGADAEKIEVVDFINEEDSDGKIIRRPFSLKTDIPALDEVVVGISDCRLLTIDPISAYLGGTDSHKNSDIRSLLMPLADLAQKHRVAIVAVTHLNKGGGNAMYRAMGSLAFIAAARAAFAVTKDQEDPSRRLFLPIKNNLGNDSDGFGYSILTAGNDAPYIAWESEPVSVSVDEALAPGLEEDAPAVNAAENFLLTELTNGPVKTKDLQKAAKDTGISWRTIERAKTKLCIEARKRHFDGFWEWSIPFNIKPFDRSTQSDTKTAKLESSKYLGGDVGLRGGDRHTRRPPRRPRRPPRFWDWRR